MVVLRHAEWGDSALAELKPWTVKVPFWREPPLMFVAGIAWSKKYIATITFKTKILIASLDKNFFACYLDESELLSAFVIAFGNINLILTAFPPLLSIPALSSARVAIIVVRHTPFVAVECKKGNCKPSLIKSTYTCVLWFVPAKSNLAASRAWCGKCQSMG